MCIRDRNITSNNVDLVPSAALQDMGAHINVQAVTFFGTVVYSPSFPVPLIDEVFLKTS